MANKKMDKDRIIELFKKQTEEDKLYIVTGIFQSLQTNSNDEKFQSEIANLKNELEEYKKISSKFIREHVNNVMKKKEEPK